MAYKEEENSSALQTQTGAEKRAARRYPVVVPVVIRWKDVAEHEVSGVLRDVNDHGIFFYAKANIPIGAQVEVVFTVAREFTSPETFCFLGTLVRTEEFRVEEKGFAVAVSRSELLGQPPAHRSESPKVTQLGPQAQTAGEEETRKASSCGSFRDPRLRPIGIVAAILCVLLLLLAFAAKVSMARQEAQSKASAVQNVLVWTDPASGLYYCPGTAWYGKKAGGKYVTQKQARLDGFHPARKGLCEVAPSPGESGN